MRQVKRTLKELRLVGTDGNVLTVTPCEGYDPPQMIFVVTTEIRFFPEEKEPSVDRQPGDPMSFYKILPANYFSLDAAATDVLVNFLVANRPTESYE